MTQKLRAAYVHEKVVVTRTRQMRGFRTYVQSRPQVSKNEGTRMQLICPAWNASCVGRAVLRSPQWSKDDMRLIDGWKIRNSSDRTHPQITPRTRGRNNAANVPTSRNQGATSTPVSCPLRPIPCSLQGARRVRRPKGQTEAQLSLKNE